MTLAPIAIVGPTGTGKSELGLLVVELLRDQGLEGHIINADAMQLYRGMDIGTAKLSLSQRRGIIHHQLDVLEVTQTSTVACYQQRASEDIERLRQDHIVPVIVGGSMLYLQSLLDDWSFPATDPQVRCIWEHAYARWGVEHLYAILQARDPQAAAEILPSDARRIIRALEVGTLTGQPFSACAPQKGHPRWGSIIMGLDCHTPTLDERLYVRTHMMFDNGLVEEVKELLAQGLAQGLTASRAVGYAQVITALDQGGSKRLLAHAQEQTFIKTRRYVRRQRSWFRRDPRIIWLDSTTVPLSDLAHQTVAYWQERQSTW